VHSPARGIAAGLPAAVIAIVVVVWRSDSSGAAHGIGAPPIEGVTVAAAGDAVCAPGSAVTATTCRQMAVSNRILLDRSVTWFLALGDLQYETGDLASFRTAYDGSFGRLKAKTKPAPGNHEYGTAGATGYYNYFGALAGDPTKGYYSFDVGSTWHVIALNSNCTAVACAAGSAQEQWLRADLAAASARPCTLAFWHHPRFSSNEHGDDGTVAPFWNALRTAGAELVLNGHDHGYERFAPQTPGAVADRNGIREIVAGTGGRSLYAFGPPHANSVVRDETFGYLRLTLGRNKYSWQFVTQAGTITDSGTGTCH
jgi:Calcineurin-like phosphoesterase/Iron/zinc purple acid phosphatase-like protein C